MGKHALYTALALGKMTGPLSLVARRWRQEDVSVALELVRLVLSTFFVENVQEP